MSQLVISNNYISGIMDEADFAPEQFAHTDVGEENKCLQIALFDDKDLMPLTAAFVAVVGDSELLNELLRGSTYRKVDGHPELHWRNIAAPDWDWDADE